MIFFFSLESWQRISRPMLTSISDRTFSFLSKRAQRFNIMVNMTENASRQGGGKGWVTFSIKQLNMYLYFPLALLIVHVPMSAKWHTFLVGLHLIIFTRFIYLGDLSRNKKSCLYKPNCDDLPMAFDIWNENTWLFGSSHWLVVRWLKRSTDGHIECSRWWNHGVLPPPRMTPLPLASSTEFSSLVCLKLISILLKCSCPHLFYHLPKCYLGV